MQKQEKLFSITALVIFLLLCVYGFWKSYTIDKNHVYVLAKVKKMFDTENGLIYEFTYSLNGKTYNSGIKGFVSLQDSFLILKLSRSNPKLWKHVEEKIPDCLLNDASLRKNWNGVPTCN